MNNSIKILEERKKILESFGTDSEGVHLLEQKLKQKLVFSLNLLEGSDLSEAETRFIIEKAEAVGGKSLHYQFLAIQYWRVTDFLSHSRTLTVAGITEEFLINIDGLRFLDLDNNQPFLKHTYKVPYVLTEYIEWLHQQTGDTFTVALNAVVKLLQSGIFVNNSARTALLLFNFLLLQSGYQWAHITEEDTDNYLRSVQVIEKGGEEHELLAILEAAANRSINESLEHFQTKNVIEDKELFKIGELAKFTKETVPTIRYWTKEGLLIPAKHSQGGYQLYHPDAAKIVLRIRQLQQSKRLSVKEIAEKLAK